MKTKTYAVAGATGFLGGHLLEELKNHAKIVVLARNHHDLPGVDLRRTDYSVESIRSCLKGVDGLVHLAAKRGGSGKVEDFHYNEILSESVFEACFQEGVTNLVFASSISVYSDEEMLPWREDQVANPVNAYGISKLSTEKLAHIYNRKGMDIKCLRFAHLYGPNERNNYMVNLLQRKAFLGEEVQVTDDEAKREFLYVEDAAYAIRLALEHPEESGVFNIGSGEALTNREVAEKICQAYQAEAPKVVPAQNPLRPSYMDSKKALEKLGFQARILMDQGMRKNAKCMEEEDHVPTFY